MHFKEHASQIIRDCDRGIQRCGECPLLECCDNTSTLATKLRRAGLDSVRIGQLVERDRRNAGHTSTP